MGAILESMAELLNQLLPEPWKAYLGWCVLLLAILTIIYVFIRRIWHRQRVYIKASITPPDHEHLNGGRVAQELATTMKRIQHIHSEEARTSSGYITSCVDPVHMNEGLGRSFDTLIAAAATINPFTDLILHLIKKLWPPVEIHGNLHFHEGTVSFAVQIMRGDQQDGYCLVDRNAGQPGVIADIIDTLAYKLILEVANSSIIRTDFSVGTKSWQSFKAHTEALDFWQSPVFDIHRDGDVKAVDRLLEASIDHDPAYAIAYYNRGTLSYLTYKNVQSNELAKRYFQEALNTVDRAQIQGRVSERTGYRRVEGLAQLGLSRCYSQLRHRYGYLDSTIIDNARRAAQCAVELLGGNAQSLYALAFAYHCTERFDAIRQGRVLYEQITDNEPNKYPAVHNNLGYILMVGGKLLMEAGEKREAEEWYAGAQQHMEAVLKMKGASSRAIDFSFANLGNLHRLRGDYRRAIELYNKALHSDPERSTYTNGLNELSLVYFDMGDIADAVYYHRLALRSTHDRSHLLKLMRQVVDTVLKNNPPVGHSLKHLYGSVSSTAHAPDVVSWLAELEAVFKPNSSHWV